MDTWNDVILISESTIKELTLIDDNLSQKKILPLIKVSQDITLKSCLGLKLLERIKKEIFNEDISDDIKYLLDYYIINIIKWDVMDTIQIPLTAKLKNAGVIQSSTVDGTSIDLDNLKYTKNFYKNIASQYINNTVTYIMDNSTKYPEFFDATYKNGKSDNFNSPIFLG